ncbi:hypothetical protein [Moheibacter sediminis]|uniref:Cell division protein ZapB n=1 Tax=Moheibacter sediminis TaxID=1434700 RepID=A0A1W1ZQJ0_9FLAO|nr:hypothetical protein [Moheibacter sediminis]SMC50666.1 hypothetical protein SAMN06296427_103154 [Moheibacter sediminis]
MNQSESNFIKLEQKLHQLLVAYKDIKKEKSSLKEEIEALKQGLKESRIETVRLKDENDRLKVANAMLGENEHRRLMKLRVNRLIKELDVCMAQIKNTKG